jgi:hypothetical protein
MTTPDPPDPDRPQPLNYHRPTRRPPVIMRTVYIVLLVLLVGAVVLFGTCWMALHR